MHEYFSSIFKAAAFTADKVNRKRTPNHSSKEDRRQFSVVESKESKVEKMECRNIYKHNSVLIFYCFITNYHTHV